MLFPFTSNGYLWQNLRWATNNIFCGGLQINFLGLCSAYDLEFYLSSSAIFQNVKPEVALQKGGLV